MEPILPNKCSHAVMHASDGFAVIRAVIEGRRRCDHYGPAVGADTESEMATVPAGSFDAWKVEICEAGNASRTMIWVDKASPLPVKFTS